MWCFRMVSETRPPCIGETSPRPQRPSSLQTRTKPLRADGGSSARHWTWNASMRAMRILSPTHHVLWQGFDVHGPRHGGAAPALHFWRELRTLVRRSHADAVARWRVRRRRRIDRRAALGAEAVPALVAALGDLHV